MSNFPLFGSVTYCLKCNDIGIGMKYRKGSLITRGTVPTEEYMERNCLRCGYTWSEVFKEVVSELPTAPKSKGFHEDEDDDVDVDDPFYEDKEGSEVYVYLLHKTLGTKEKVRWNDWSNDKKSIMINNRAYKKSNWKLITDDKDKNLKEISKNLAFIRTYECVRIECILGTPHFQCGDILYIQKSEWLSKSTYFEIGNFVQSKSNWKVV